MKQVCALITLLFALGFQSFGQQTIPDQNQVILSTSCWSKVEWIPSEKQTAQALASIEQLLDNPEALRKFGRRHAKEGARIQEHYSGYNVQFAGVIKNGKKYIHCNFLRAQSSLGRNWETQYVFVFDGGFWYWRILYDPETGELIDLQINGYP